MITGYVIKRSDTDFVVNCDSHGIGGYNVVPKEIAKDCEYTLEEVRIIFLIIQKCFLTLRQSRWNDSPEKPERSVTTYLRKLSIQSTPCAGRL